MEEITRIQRAGVVGAGGAGFPTHAKLNCRAETVIANGAECEPLLRVDQLLMEKYARRLVAGLEAAMAAVGANTGVIATKRHYFGAVAALNEAIGGKPRLRLHLMKSYYPAGDEKSLIHEVLGRVVPGGRLPADVGCVVSNVGTLIGVADGMEGRPVTHKHLTVGGAVENPVTLCAPIGTPIRQLIRLAGLPGDEGDYALIAGGPCMGKLEEDWDAGITKTTGGLLLFPRLHPVIQSRTMPLARQIKLARAVCCQCSQCTLMCPRNRLGLGVEPHKAMRAAAGGNPRLLGDVDGILSCSGCGLCTNYACTMGLQPSRIMTMLREELIREGARPRPREPVVADSGCRLRQVPVSRLIARMGLSEYDRPAPLLEEPVTTGQVRIPLSMHVGKPSLPVMRVGENVRAGDRIADIPGNALGAAVHASIDGRITGITGDYIEITG